mmetsp:Transcript_17413/g.28090  ORF Transcript_17413/g.28090 Transcript_17413/m.28090 type:complete len:115 (-) Transcript_17413:1997-2341(-)
MSLTSRVEELVTLFASWSVSCEVGACGDDRERVFRSMLTREDPAVVNEVFKVLERRSSLLRDRGDVETLQNAVASGGYVLCKSCQGLISKEREAIHLEQWCPGKQGGEEMEMSD